MTGKDSKKKETGKRRRTRLLGLVLAVYMAAGYLTTAFRVLEVSESVEPRLSLPTPPRNLISGVFSVHTERSHDAHGTKDQVAAAASKAGLDFVIIGDHPPDPRRPDWEIWEPEFREDVLIDGGVGPGIAGRDADAQREGHREPSEPGERGGRFLHGGHISNRRPCSASGQALFLVRAPLRLASLR